MEQVLCNVLHCEGGTVADPKNLQGQESFSLALYWLVLGASMGWPGLVVAKVPSESLACRIMANGTSALPGDDADSLRAFDLTLFSA